MTTIATVLIGDESGCRDDEVPGWRHRVKGKSLCQLFCGLVNSRSCLFSDPTFNRVSYTRLSRSLAFPICRPPCLKGRQMQPSAARLRTSFASMSLPNAFSSQKDKPILSGFSSQRAKKNPKKEGKGGKNEELSWEIGI